MKIRTITTGIPFPCSEPQLQRAAEFNAACQTRFEANRYEVQTTRVSSQVWDKAPNIDVLLKLEADARQCGIEFLNLGTLLPEKQHTETHLAQVADVIVQSEVLYASVTLTTQSQQGATGITENTADIIQQIAHRTDAGYGNLRLRSL